MVGFDALIGKKSLDIDIGYDKSSKAEEVSVDQEKVHDCACAISNHQSNEQNANKGSDQVKRYNIIDIVKGKIIDLLTDQIGEPYAAVRIKDYLEAIPISSTRFTGSVATMVHSTVVDNELW